MIRSLTLTKWAGGDLYSVCDTEFGMTGSDGVDLSERFEVVHRDLVTREVKHDILQRTSVLS